VVGGTRYVPEFNGVGDLVGVLDTDGNEVYRCLYDAFGRVLSETGTNPLPFGHHGPCQMKLSGGPGDPVFYLPEAGRLLWPQIGRYTAPDKVGSSSNRYVYCRNNPVSEVDPDGAELASTSKERKMSLLRRTESRVFELEDAARQAVENMKAQRFTCPDEELRQTEAYYSKILVPLWRCYVYLVQEHPLRRPRVEYAWLQASTERRMQRWRAVIKALRTAVARSEQLFEWHVPVEQTDRSSSPRRITGCPQGGGTGLVAGGGSGHSWWETTHHTGAVIEALDRGVPQSVAGAAWGLGWDLTHEDLERLHAGDPEFKDHPGYVDLNSP